MTTPHESDSQNIDSILREDRLFPPPTDLERRVGPLHMKSMEEYRKAWEKSIRHPEEFWSTVAGELDWFRPWDSVLEWNPPDARWFIGGRINACHNCLDRQVLRGHGAETALIWEGEPVQEERTEGFGVRRVHEIRRLTYAELLRDTARCANVLKALGVRKGDVVTIYMGMVPELTIAMLACARIGAAHSVIFGGFSSQAIADRVDDAQSRVVITCDGAWRRGKIVPLKENVDRACELTKRIEQVIVLRRCGSEVAWHSGRDHSWHDLMLAVDDNCPCEWLDSEELLFLLYTSGSTGKPKGIRHVVGGYLVHTTMTARLTFNLHPDHGQVFWCTADIGWITGHSYIVYGILPNRVPTLMYEGAPDTPQPDRFWDIVERHRVTHFYTAPTAIRAFMKWGDEHPKRHDLSSLCVLGTVGEPINPEAWMWYHRVIGHERCPIVDTWWQTETGGHMITPLPGVTPTVPGSCTLPMLGIDAAIVDADGNEQPANVGGFLVIRGPWPSMLRGIHGDRDRFVDTYFSKFANAKVPGMYLAGDGARRDERGYFWIMGRIDDVINVSGHRLGTMEVESALVSHPAVVEAAVVGMPHEIKGTGVAAFCTLAPGHEASEPLRSALREHVANEIGAIAKPDLIRFTATLPKTRSGKIMRRLLRDIAAGNETTGDTTTLEDYGVLARLREDQES